MTVTALSNVSVEQMQRVLSVVRQQAPRIQCLTNTVAQAITANCLLALGAGVSMATLPDEIIDMSTGAAAVLINLGTLDEARRVAIPRLLDNAVIREKPIVLDPVFAQHSPVRLQLAHQILRGDRVIIKGNADEMSAFNAVPSAVTTITTGSVDRIAQGHRHSEIPFGHPGMALVTGLGCAVGAIIAACAAVEADPIVASAAALAIAGLAGEEAGRRTRGSGSFAVAFVDALSLSDAATLPIWIAAHQERAS
jgi:hydroxyethylthiazole kinase